MGAFSAHTSDTTCVALVGGRLNPCLVWAPHCLPLLQLSGIEPVANLIVDLMHAALLAADLPESTCFVSLVRGTWGL